jgi:hypothetical protein
MLVNRWLIHDAKECSLQFEEGDLLLYRFINHSMTILEPVEWASSRVG